MIISNMRIATFNLENLDFDQDSRSDFLKRLAILRPQIQRINAEILLLQEVNSQKIDGENKLLALSELIKNTRYANFNISSTLNDNGEPFTQRNLIILSNFEVLQTKQYKHQAIMPPQYKTATGMESKIKDITWERPILHSQIKIKDNLIIEVFNLHLKSKNGTSIKGTKRDSFSWQTASGWAESSFLSTIRRVGQALEMRTIIDTIFDNDEKSNIVVGGDFNSDTGEIALEAILGRTENTGNEELNPRVLIPCENSIPKPSRFTLFHHGKKNMLDHLLISKNLLQFYSHSEIHNETLKDESIAFATDKKYPDSDHAPVVAEFRGIN